MTSLPDHEAICHVTASVIQRSRGRSAVAASAYRSAARLADARTGEVWDYSRKKHVTNSFVTAPPGAPSWVHDRETLWSRAELAERRRDAQTAREVTVSIPRDLPEAAWRPFLDDVTAPYVGAGAIVDVAIHCPRAGGGGGGENPHAHILLTVRALDPAGPQGFATTRNAALAALFESGGRLGPGKRGDALKAERERIASVINDHLRASGSKRRADARSYKARGDPRAPEPKLGENRMASIRRARRHDRRTALVAALREARRTETQLTKLEMQMALSARGFPSRAAPGRQQDYKVAIIRDRHPDADLTGVADALHMVDGKDPRRLRILTRDGGWTEVDDQSGTIRTWGRPGRAADLAQRLSDATGYPVEPLPRSATAGRPGGRRRPGPPSEAEALSIGDRWRRRGYSDVTESPAGVVVRVGAARLVDSGDHNAVYGPVSDDAIRALVAKAAEEWSGSLRLDGPWSEEAKAKVWLEAQRQGVELADYEPSPETIAAWEAEQGGAAGTASALKAVRNEAKEADLLLAAASGDVAALKKLDPDLKAFVTSFLDDDQRQELVRQDRAALVPELARFRVLGAAERADLPDLDAELPAPRPAPEDPQREVRPS